MIRQLWTQMILFLVLYSYYSGIFLPVKIVGKGQVNKSFQVIVQRSSHVQVKSSHVCPWYCGLHVSTVFWLSTDIIHFQSSVVKIFPSSVARYLRPTGSRQESVVVGIVRQVNAMILFYEIDSRLQVTFSFFLFRMA